MSFNFIICSMNSKYIHSSSAAWCLYSSCKKYCCNDIEVSLIESTVNETQEKNINKIILKKPNVVAFSCYIWNIAENLSLCSKLKVLFPELKIILGGPEVSFCQKKILSENPSVDYILSGEGEVTLPKLINSIFLGVADDIPSLSYRTDTGVYIDNRTAPVTDEMFHFCEEFFHTLNGRIAYIESSRGCPFRCAFCLSGRLGSVRYFDIEKVKSYMIRLSGSGAKTIKFVDRTFNCNKKRAGEIFSFILSQYGNAIPKGVCFHFEIAADLLDDELFDVISRLPVGSVQFEIGIQSFNERVLEAINRKSDLDKVLKNIKKLISFRNCHIHIDLIAGLPQESYDSFVKGFNKAYVLEADMLQLGFLKVLSGSDLAENREKYPCEYNSEPPYEVVSTPYISREDLLKLYIAENELERLYNSGRFHRTLHYVLQATKKTPYDIFYECGVYFNSLNKSAKVPLDEYTNLVFDYFSSLNGVDKLLLRDNMIYDRISVNNSGVIPERLKISDSNMKKVKNIIKEKVGLVKGVNRSVAILYCENKVIYCDYKNYNPISGEYEVAEIDLSAENIF